MVEGEGGREGVRELPIRSSHTGCDTGRLDRHSLLPAYCFISLVPPSPRSGNATV